MPEHKELYFDYVRKSEAYSRRNQKKCLSERAQRKIKFGLPERIKRKIKFLRRRWQSRNV